MIVVSSIHYINEPTQIALLDVHGRLFAEYWHAGHIAHRPGSLDIADVDGDGRKEIYAVGVNNARQRATLVILDPDTMSGASNEPRGFQLRGFDTDGALARVFFPRSSMNLAENQYNFAEGVFPGADGIVVSTVELYNSDDSPGIIHRLDLDLVLRDISFGDTFRSTHAKLVRQGAIDPITLEEELQMLWQQGIEVLRPGSDSIANGGCP